MPSAQAPPKGGARKFERMQSMASQPASRQLQHLPSFFAYKISADPNEQKSHYDSDYVESLKPESTAPRTFDEWLAMVTVFLIATSSYLFAYSPTWLLDGPELTTQNRGKRFREAVWIRRMLTLENVAWVPGRAASMTVAVPPMGEFHSARTHLAALKVIAQPSFLSKAFLVFSDVIAVPVTFITCYIWPALVHLIAMYTAELASRLYTDLLDALDKGELPDLANAKCPTVARQYYGLPTNADFRDAVLAMRADEVYLAHFHHSAARHNDDPLKHMK